MYRCPPVTSEILASSVTASFLVTSSKKQCCGSESGSISQRYGSADPDPYQNFGDPQRQSCEKVLRFIMYRCPPVTSEILASSVAASFLDTSSKFSTKSGTWKEMTFYRKKAKEIMFYRKKAKEITFYRKKAKEIMFYRKKAKTPRSKPVLRIRIPLIRMYVFRSPGSGSVSRWYESGSLYPVLWIWIPIKLKGRIRIRVRIEVTSRIRNRQVK